MGCGGMGCRAISVSALAVSTTFSSPGAVFRRLIEEGINGNRREVLLELVAEGLIDPTAPPGAGREGLMAFIAAASTAFADFQYRIDELLEDGERAAARVRVSGTHVGDFLGIPASGRSFSIGGIGVVHVVGGRVVEHWGFLDRDDLLAQLKGEAEAPSS